MDVVGFLVFFFPSQEKEGLLLTLTPEKLSIQCCTETRGSGKRSRRERYCPVHTVCMSPKPILVHVECLLLHFCRNEVFDFVLDLVCSAYISCQFARFCTFEEMLVFVLLTARFFDTPCQSPANDTISQATNDSWVLSSDFAPYGRSVRTVR